MANDLILSVIIVNYKTPDLTIEAIRSLKQYVPWVDSEKAEVIVVDNASNDGSLNQIRQALPWVKLIANDKNTGFSGGNNVGMKLAKGKFVLLLNSDTVSIEDAVSPMIDWLTDHPEAGIVTPQLLYEDRSIQPTGGYFPTLPRVFAWMFFIDDLPLFNRFFKSFHPDSRSYNTEKYFFTVMHQLDWITGAYMLMRHEVIDQTGYFDEAMFMYAEEMEYCYRADQKGFTCYFVPIAKIIHLQGKSSPNLRSPILGEYKNIVYFYRKHHSTLAVLLVKALLKIGALLRVVLFTVLGKKEVAHIYAEAFTSI